MPINPGDTWRQSYSWAVPMSNTSSNLKDSEQCYAAMVSAVSGVPIHAAQAALYGSGRVQEDGSVGIRLSSTRLEMPDTVSPVSVVEIDPLEQVEDPQEILRLMDVAFKAGRAVTFLHRKVLDEQEILEEASRDPEENSGVKYHWMLFTGYPVIHGKPGPVHTINPLREEAGYTSRSAIIDIINRSNDYETGGQGVFLEAISNGLASGT